MGVGTKFVRKMTEKTKLELYFLFLGMIATKFMAGHIVSKGLHSFTCSGERGQAGQRGWSIGVMRPCDTPMVRNSASGSEIELPREISA